MSASSQQVVAKLDQLLKINSLIEQHLNPKGKAPAGKGGKEGDGKKAEKSEKNEKLEAMASLSTSMAELVKALKDSKTIDPKKGEKLGEFVFNFASKIKQIVDEFSPENLKEFSNLMDVLLTKSTNFVWKMALVAIVMPIALIGAAGFGLMMKMILAIIGKSADVSKETAKGLESLLDISKALAIFSLTMVFVGFLAKQALVGFGILAMVILGLALVLKGVDKIAGGSTFNPISKGPLGSLARLAKGMALFSLVLIGISLAGEMIAKGFLVFSLVVLGLAVVLRIADMIGLGGVTPLSKGPLGSLMRLAKGMALFSLTLILMALAAPIIAMGFLVFSLVILGLALVLRIVDVIAGGGFNPMSSGPLGSLAKLGMGLAIFAITMVALTFFKMEFAIGVLMIALAIIALGAVIWGLSKVLNKGGLASLNPIAKGPLPDLLKMSKALMIFAITAIGVGYFVGEFAKGALALILSLLALAIVMVPYGKAYMRRGAKVLLRNVTPAIAAFALAIGAFSFIADKTNLTWNKLAMLGAALAGAALVAKYLGSVKNSLDSERGAKVLLKYISPAIGVFGAALGLYSQLSKDLTWSKLAMLGAAIGTAALVATVLGIEPIWLAAEFGAKALLQISYAFGIFAGALGVYASLSKDLTWSKLAMLGAAIVGASAVATLLGIGPMPAFAIAGATALLEVSFALAVFAGALSIFALSRFDKKDGDNLKHALHSVMLGMFGYNSFDDMGLTAAVAIPARAVGLVLMGVAMIGAAIALVPFTASLAIFKATKWTPADSISLKFALMSVGNAFADIAKGDNWYKMQQGIYGMRDIGNTLVSLAAGIQAMANMTFTEYEWDDKTKKLEPKKKVKLTPVDVAQAALNAGFIISTLIEPIAKLGELFGGGFGGDNQYAKRGITPFSLDMGISSMSSIGTGLSKIAGAVQDWATFGYWEYGLVYNPKTKMNELRPTARKKLTPIDVALSSLNISFVLGSLIRPLAAFGALMAGGQAAGNLTSGLAGFLGVGKNPVEQGIKSLSSLGNGLSKVAQGVQDWATMDYTEYGVQFNAKTGMNELKPIAKKRISQKQLERAQYNIKQTLLALAVPVASFGALMAGGQAVGWLTGGLASLWGGGKNPVEDGIKSIASLGNGIQSVAKGVQAFATMTFIEQIVVKNPKTGKNELQPGKVVRLGQPSIDKATENIKNVLLAMVKAVARYSWEVSKYGTMATFEKAIKNASTISKGLSEIISTNKAIFEDANGPNKMKTGKDVIEGLKHVILTGASTVALFKHKLKTQGIDEDKLDFILDAITNVTSTFVSVYTSIEKHFLDTKKVSTVSTNWSNFFSKLFQPFNPKSLSNFTSFNDLFIKYISNIVKLTNSYTRMDFTLKPTLLWKYNRFAEITSKLAKIADPFTKFTKAFGDMAKHMGVFAKNFNVMDPIAIKAFHEWSKSMIEVSKIDISKSGAILDFTNKMINAAYGGGDAPTVDKNKKPDDYSEADKKAQTRNVVPLGGKKEKKDDDGKGKGGGGGGALSAAQLAQITQAVKAGIVAGLKNLEIDKVTVTGSFNT